LDGLGRGWKTIQGAIRLDVGRMAFLHGDLLYVENLLIPLFLKESMSRSNVLGGADMFLDRSSKDKLGPGETMLLRGNQSLQVLELQVGHSPLGERGSCFLILASFSTRNARISASELTSLFNGVVECGDDGWLRTRANEDA